MTSKRKIENRLEDLEGPTGYGDLPPLSLASLISADEFKIVDEEQRIYRLDGELRQDSLGLEETLFDRLDRYDS